MDPLLTRLGEFLLEKIAPSVVSHGGAIEIIGLTDNRLKIGLSGACSTCSMDTFTKEGIAEFMLNEFPELDDCEVIDLEDTGAGALPPLAATIKNSP